MEFNIVEADPTHSNILCNDDLNTGSGLDCKPGRILIRRAVQHFHNSLCHVGLQLEIEITSSTDCRREVCLVHRPRRPIRLKVPLLAATLFAQRHREGPAETRIFAEYALRAGASWRGRRNGVSSQGHIASDARHQLVCDHPQLRLAHDLARALVFSQRVVESDFIVVEAGSFATLPRRTNILGKLN